MSIAADTRECLAEMGEATVSEIADALGLTGEQVGQALTAGIGKWSERLGRGRYRSLNSSTQPAATTSAELRPLIDSLPVDGFDRIGLFMVARTQDGGFICTDRNGVAWKLEVTVTARLI
jgi:hypothetical protein